MTGKKITLADIRAFSLCYDPAKYLPENWKGTALDILNVVDCPVEDRLWVVLRNEFMTDKELRLFAVWCARSVPQTDERSINAINAAERYANGEATDEEMYAARHAAMSAASDAAWSAARYAASDAARSAQINYLKNLFS